LRGVFAFAKSSAPFRARFLRKKKKRSIANACLSMKAAVQVVARLRLDPARPRLLHCSKVLLDSLVAPVRAGALLLGGDFISVSGRRPISPRTFPMPLDTSTSGKTETDARVLCMAE